MPIWKIDGTRYLDSGSAVVFGDAVIEVEFNPDPDRTLLASGEHQQVAIKFRPGDGEPEIRVGNPSGTRSVIHLVNFPADSSSAASGVEIKPFENDSLFIAFSIDPHRTADGVIRTVNYTFYRKRRGLLG